MQLLVSLLLSIVISFTDHVSFDYLSLAAAFRFLSFVHTHTHTFLLQYFSPVSCIIVCLAEGLYYLYPILECANKVPRLYMGKIPSLEELGLLLEPQAQ